MTQAENSGPGRALMERIRKLLELAKDPSNEHEAAVAARKAHELIEKHNLSIGEVELGATPSAEERFLCGERPPQYLGILVAVVELLFDCASIKTREGLFGPACIAICGIPKNVEAAALTLHYLVESVRSMARARRELLVLKRKASARANRKRMASYRYGASCRVMNEIQKEKRIAQDDTNRLALVFLGKAVARRHLEEKYPRRRTLKADAANLDGRSFALGWDDGIRINPRGVHKKLAAAGGGADGAE